MLKRKPSTKELEIAFYNRPCNFMKTEYKPIMPCVIYQTWCTKDLPPKMRERVDLLRSQNPGFKHYLFDDNDCREFIKRHFRPDVLDAYDILIPGAYKADLWRLCVLFINGGVYVDIKFACVNGFKLIELTENNNFVKDRPKGCIYNALMTSVAGNPILFRAIRRIVFNVQNKFYGYGPLCPTGPDLLGSVAIRNNFAGVNIAMRHYKHGGFIIYKNRFIISTEYPEYRNEAAETNRKINKQHYLEAWEKRAIYA